MRKSTVHVLSGRGTREGVRRAAGFGQLRAVRRKHGIPVRPRWLLAAVAALSVALPHWVHAASTASANPRVYVVRAGDTLWSIAETMMPDKDTRRAVDELEQLNALSGAEIYPGERLLLPPAGR
ncbi:MAG: LysM peptidoglycan-binding domain-containing protein [Thermoflavifilum sp.]|nr:LysM peptidoglycan-binding domain-containing protein [Thermoflavifilum sp.]MCL6514563.1 LysM peptidoglycan-binding domain-containing protein [Alicyclobacillus sp.]